MKIWAVGLTGGVAHYADTAVNTPVYIILTPNEYYTELPALAINAASNKPGLAASASHTASFIYGIYIAPCSIYTLLRCSIMTVLSLRKILFYIFG